MSNGTLITLIAVIAFIVVSLAVGMFFLFRFFLEKERRRGEEFRAGYRKD